MITVLDFLRTGSLADQAYVPVKSNDEIIIIIKIITIIFCGRGKYFMHRQEANAYRYYFHRGTVLTSHLTPIRKLLLLPWLVCQGYSPDADHSPFTHSLIYSHVKCVEVSIVRLLSVGNRQEVKICLSCPSIYTVFIHPFLRWILCAFGTIPHS